MTEEWGLSLWKMTSLASLLRCQKLWFPSSSLSLVVSCILYFCPSNLLYSATVVRDTAEENWCGHKWDSAFKSESRENGKRLIFLRRAIFWIALLETCYWKQSIPVPRRLTVNQLGLYYPFQVYSDHQRIDSPCRSVIPAPHRHFIHKHLEKLTIKPCYEVLGVREFCLLLLQKRVKLFISVKLLLCSHKSIAEFGVYSCFYSRDPLPEKWGHCIRSDELAPFMVVSEAWLCSEPHPALLTLWVALLKSIVITSIKISGTTCINKISKIWPKGWLISMFLISHFHKC